MNKPQNLIISIFIFFFQPLFCQTTMELTRNNRTSKITFKDDCLFTLNHIRNDGEIIKKQIYFGNLLNIKDSIISIKSTECNTVTKNAQGKWIIDYQVYQSDTIIKLNLRDISDIEMDRNWFVIPALMGSAAIISAVILSPIASANFKDKTFNSEKYLKLTAFSLLTSGACFTVAYTIARKHYYLNSTNDNKHHKLWHIKTTDFTIK